MLQAHEKDQKKKKIETMSPTSQQMPSFIGRPRHYMQ
jgi:hypothetical protein